MNSKALDFIGYLVNCANHNDNELIEAVTERFDVTYCTKHVQGKPRHWFEFMEGRNKTSQVTLGAEGSVREAVVGLIAYHLRK